MIVRKARHFLDTDGAYAAYRLYLLRREAGEPFFTFSGWLRHFGHTIKETE